MAAAKEKHWIGFDLGGTKMMAVLYNDAGEALGRVRKKTKVREGAKAVIDRMVGVIGDCLQVAGVGPGSLGGIGAGCPGPLDLDAGVILDAPNLGFHNVNLKGLLEREFACPASILNDVDAGLYGEFVGGAARGARCAVGVFPGTGVGGACVYEGAIFRGAKGSCLEIGHVPVVRDGPRCGCGRRGCLESVAGRLAISAAAAQAAYRGEAPNLLTEAGTDIANIGSSVLARSVAAGDKAVEEIVRQAARWIGSGVAILVNLLLPDTVVLGGGLVEAMPELILDEAGKAARKQVMPGFVDTFRMAVAGLGDDAVALGASSWVRTRIGGGRA